ncbi:ATP-grasp domain-containing protein [Candidatus Bathyarchaeota archaeon]|nr:MAG: ATP-grasp domain-containing protein [Candidatus Bathyarchaeota archaeon]
MVTLVCGVAREEPVEMLVQSLNDLGAEYYLLDQEALVDEVELRWQISDNGIKGHIKVRGDVINIHEVTSVYHRFMNPEDIHNPEDSINRINQNRSIIRSLMDLFDVLPARIVNRRRPMMSNNSKPYQAMLIKKAGFAIADTIITNNPKTVMEFAAWNGPLIYKSISSVRSIVDSLDEGSASRIDSIAYQPTQFQQKIEGFNLRVHVIGKKLFGTKITSSAVDYRYAAHQGSSTNMRPYELTVELTKKCLNLAKICELEFIGIDLIINEDKAYCLEVNPSPGYSYYQNITKQPISDTLGQYLMEPDSVS